MQIPRVTSTTDSTNPVRTHALHEALEPTPIRDNATPSAAFNSNSMLSLTPLNTRDSVNMQANLQFPSPNALPFVPPPSTIHTKTQHMMPTTAVSNSLAVSTNINSGNDRVTMDNAAHKPLISSATILPPPQRYMNIMSANAGIQIPTTGNPYSPRPLPPNLSKRKPSAGASTSTKKKTSLPPDPSRAVNPAFLPLKTKTPTSIEGDIKKFNSMDNKTTKTTPSAKREAVKFKSLSNIPLSSLKVTPPPVPTVAPAPPVMDEAAIIEEAIRKARSPLVDLYSPYIIPSDKSLGEARSRLKKGIEQTRELRAAFTERVYGKYRVCLRPPPTNHQIFNRIATDPVNTSHRLKDEIKQLKSEKEIEKKEAQKLNAELNAANTAANAVPGETSSATVAMNAETAEQLMFISAGLSLIILPEHDITGTSIDMSGYPDRAPLNPETGQRVRSISAAAAAAGEVMLDRARKGATMRVERKRRRHAQLIAGDDPEKDGDANYSRLSLLSNHTGPMHMQSKPSIMLPPTATTNVTPASFQSSTPSTKSPATPTTPSITPKAYSGKRSTTSKQSTPGSTASSAKAIRARVQATMSNNTLLSLNPTAEELRTDGKAGAATLAIMEKGVGISQKAAQQQRYRHPFPNSIGGRRRAFGVKKELETYSQNMALALPPLPTPKERKLRQPVPVFDAEEYTTSRSKEAIHTVLKQFVIEGERQRKRRITEISFLHGLEHTSAVTPEDTKQKDEKKPAIDAVLAFNVLRSVGLVRPSSSEADMVTENFQSVMNSSLVEVAEKRALGEYDGQSHSSIVKLKELTKKFAANKRTFSDALFASNDEMVEETKHLKDDVSSVLGKSESNKVGKQDTVIVTGASKVIKSSSANLPTVSIRGGGQQQQPHVNVCQPMGGKTVNQAANESTTVQQQHSPGRSGSRSTNIGASGGNPVHTAEMAPHRMVWDETSHQPLMLINPQLARTQEGYRLTSAATAAHHKALAAQHGSNASSPTRNVQMRGQLPPTDHYHQANALQLARQLQHASTSIQRLPTHGNGELEAYIGGLQKQPSSSGYEWSQMGAAAVASLGLSPHRSAVVNYSVQDSARAILAREQQTAAAAAAQRQQAVALMGRAVGHAYSPGANPNFPHVAGHASALISSSAALVGHSGIPPAPTPSGSAPVANVQPPAKQQGESNPLAGIEYRQVTNKEPRSNSLSSRDSKDEGSNDKVIKNLSKKDDSSALVSQNSLPVDGKEEVSIKKRKLSSDSSQSEKRRNVAKDSHRIPVEPKRINFKNSVAASESNGIEIQKKVSTFEAPPNSGEKTSVSTNIIQKDSGGAATLIAKDITESPEPKPSSIRTDDATSVNIPPPRTSGMQFYVPPAPHGIPPEIASFVLNGRVFEAIHAWETGEAVFDAGIMVDYLMAVGVAVPIPKALVVNPLKERIGVNALKNNSFGNFPTSSREVIAALILLWLWKHHEEGFQKAFAKSGRIDVDPECKWLINAAVDRAILALSQEIKAPGSSLSSALINAKSKGGSSHKTSPGTESERPQGKTTKVDLLSASIVSKSLMAGISVYEHMDSLLPHFHDMILYLDECRKCALHSKAQERALLAALISRKATMSLPFSHAYASSMVRAGETIGHGELFEVVQNEDVKVSTMIPYDVFTDESGSWEDPCRPVGGFTAGLTGDDLMRRAHARAMVQKSLKKLQDRHNIKGGTPDSGPYTDPPSSSSSNNSDGSKSASGSSNMSTPRGWLKRRSSSFNEPKIQPGTGSAPATSLSFYDPKHHSSPLEWNSEDPRNGPYGSSQSDSNSAGGGRRRSLSQGQGTPSTGKGNTPRGKKVIADRSLSVGAYDDSKEEHKYNLLRSTHEISWSDVASVFQNVKLPVKKKKTQEHATTPKDRTIFAPYVRQIEVPADVSDRESDTEEDLRDEKVLSRHQEVLDKMKEKLSMFLKARKQSQERKKSGERGIKKV